MAKILKKQANNQHYNNKYYVAVNVKRGMFSQNTPITTENTGVCSDTVTKKNYIKKNYKEILTSFQENDDYIYFDKLDNTKGLKIGFHIQLVSSLII